MTPTEIILQGGGLIPPKGIGGEAKHGFLVYFNSPCGTTLCCDLDSLSVELVREKIEKAEERFFCVNEIKAAESRAKSVAWVVVSLIALFSLCYTVSRNDRYIEDNGHNILQDRLSANAANGNYGEGF